MIELTQGSMLALAFIVISWCVNAGIATPGQAAGIITSYITASTDIAFVSEVLLKMKFNCEGLRMISRILNFPTEAHTLSAQSDANAHHYRRLMRPCVPPTVKQPPSSSSLDATSGHNDSSGAGYVAGLEPEEELRWTRTIYLNKTKFVCRCVRNNAIMQCTRSTS